MDHHRQSLPKGEELCLGEGHRVGIGGSAHPQTAEDVELCFKVEMHPLVCIRGDLLNTAHLNMYMYIGLHLKQTLSPIL